MAQLLLPPAELEVKAEGPYPGGGGERGHLRDSREGVPVSLTLISTVGPGNEVGGDRAVEGRCTHAKLLS